MLRLVGVDNEQLGIVKFMDALRMAEDKDLDLVEIAPNAVPPVARIMDYGKFKYEEAKRAHEAKLKQKTRAAKIASLYTRTPPYDAALEELETFSLDRLKVLRGIERARLSNSSETDVRQKTKELLRKYLAGSGDEVRKDQISHFMLRLAYCQTEDLRR